MKRFLELRKDDLSGRAATNQGQGVLEKRPSPLMAQVLRELSDSRYPRM